MTRPTPGKSRTIGALGLRAIMLLWCTMAWASCGDLAPAPTPCSGDKDCPPGFSCFLTEGRCVGATGLCGKGEADYCVQQAVCSAGYCTLHPTEFSHQTEEIELRGPPVGATLNHGTTFLWSPTGRREVAVGLFRRVPEFDDAANEFKNADDAIWVWHTGLGGREGRVSFGDGRSLVQGTGAPQFADPVLPHEGTYYWAVWAWEGDEIKIASGARYIVVGNVEEPQGKPCEEAATCGHGFYHGDCLKGTCVYRCASIRDCPKGQPCDLGFIEGSFTYHQGHLWGGLCQADGDG